MKNEAVVAPLVARSTPADRVGAAGVVSTVMGRLCGRALPLFNVVVLHDVRCRTLPVLLLRGPRVIYIYIYYVDCLKGLSAQGGGI